MYLTSKYGLAFHLALLAAAAFFAVPFFPGAVSTIAVLCLTAAAWEWIVAEPSVRTGETRAEARVRTLAAMAKDPLLWISCAMLLIALVRWINSGIEFEYSAGAARWELKGPMWPDAPAGVDSAVSGGLFAIFAAMATVTLAVRHALGAKARMAFGVSLSFCAGLAGWCAIFAAEHGDGTLLAAAMEDLVSSRAYGLPFGICLVAGAMCAASADEYGWKGALFMSGLGMSGCAAALSFFCPPLYTYVYCGVAAFAALAGMLKCALSVSIASATRIFITASVAFGGLFVSVLAVPEVAAAKADQAAQTRKAAPDKATDKTAESGEDAPRQSIYEALKERREAVAEVSSGLWKAGRGRWLGAGTGVFGLRAKEHIAGMTDKAARRRLWKVLPYELEKVRPADFHAGFAMEHGIIGVVLVAVWFLIAAAEWVRKMVVSVRSYVRTEDGPPAMFSFPPVCWCFPLVLGLGVFSGFYCMQAECANLLPLSAVMALSAAAFPKVKTAAPPAPSDPPGGAGSPSQPPPAEAAAPETVSNEGNTTNG